MHLRASVYGYLRYLARAVNDTGRKDQGRFGKPRNSVGVATFGRPKPIRTVDFGAAWAATEAAKSSQKDIRARSDIQ